MSFSHPLILFLLEIPVLALLIGVWRRQTRRVVLPYDFAPGGRGRVWAFLLNCLSSLPVLVLAEIVAILAGPLQLSEPKTKRRMSNIEFCVDISGSMMARFGSGTRYDVSMEAITEFLDFREGDAFGLTFFGNSVLHWTPLTNDASAIKCAPPYMRPENAPPGFGGTEIGKALRACGNRLEEREKGDKMIILVSDGFSFDLSDGNDEAIARELKAKEVVIYAIHIAESQIPDEVVNVTNLTGGAVFSPGDKEGLKEIFKRIDSMQKAELELQAAETMDHFRPWCLAGLSMLGAYLLSLFGLRYTPW